MVGDQTEEAGDLMVALEAEEEEEDLIHRVDREQPPVSAAPHVARSNRD